MLLAIQQTLLFRAYALRTVADALIKNQVRAFDFRAYALLTVVKSWKNGTSPQGGAELNGRGCRLARTGVPFVMYRSAVSLNHGARR